MLVVPIHQNSGNARVTCAFHIVKNAVADVDDLFARTIRGARRQIENTRVGFFDADNPGDDEE